MKLEIDFIDEELQPKIYMTDDKVSKIIIEAPKIEIDKVINKGTNEERVTIIRINSTHICPRCEKDRPIEHYYTNRNAAYGIETYCIICRKEIQKGRRK